jgi:hypothetical protein
MFSAGDHMNNNAYDSPNREPFAHQHYGSFSETIDSGNLAAPQPLWSLGCARLDGWRRGSRPAVNSARR